MATAGASSFSDVAEGNQYETAIDVLDALKVFIGYGDGTFKPDGELTRAEAAVLVYRIATGDVEGKYVDNYTYMANAKFDDLSGYNWARGYINYCQNAGIVVGTSATKFSPADKVTGYQLMVMVLRTLGYGKAGEFTQPGKWELETASKCESLGMLKNVTTGDFGAPAKRAMVAEILFQGLLQNTVKYSALTPGGYTNDETLGKKTLGLERIEGVVMANEYADLTSSKTLADGKTKLDVDGKNYTLDTTTTLEDIGENRMAYIQNGSKVLYMEDTGNTTDETTDKMKVSELLDRAGIKDGGVPFINFDEVKAHDSSYRLKYVTVWTTELGAEAVADNINGASGITNPRDDGYADVNPVKVKDDDGNETITGYEVTRVIPPRTPITAVDLFYMEDIFGVADDSLDGFYYGEIYVGTQSVVDISDVKNDDFKYSYEKFYDEFIDEKDGDTVTTNDNGNWLKVIDNDGDGVAEYILKTIYTVAQVSKVKDDTITLDTKNRTLWNEDTNKSCTIDTMNNLTSQKVVANDAMDVDDIVYYAIIDGKAQTYLAEKVTATIEKVDHNKLIATTTDGTEYTQSDVCEHIEDEAYDHDVRNLAGKVSYDLFLDKGGYLAAFVKPEASNLSLITDAWFNQLKTSQEYAVKVYNDETGKIDTVDVTTNATLFIDSEVVKNNGWGGLKYFGGNNTGKIGALNGNGKHEHTIVAAITEDGTILPVENTSVSGRYQRNILDLHYTKADNTLYSKIPTKTAVTGYVYDTVESSNTETAYNKTNPATAEIRATTNTVYYIVYDGAVVARSVGYANAPSLKDVEDIYAVGTLRTPDNNLTTDPYYTADVVVIEVTSYDGAKELVFVVDDTARDSDVNIRRVTLIHADGKLEDDVRIDWSNNTQGYSDNADGGKKIQPGFYYMSEKSEDLYKLTGNETNNDKPLNASEILATGKIAVGQIDLSKDLKDETYVVTQNWDTDTYVIANNGVGTDDVHYNSNSNSIASVDYLASAVLGKTSEGTYNLTDDTQLYKLAYGSRGWKNADYPVVADADADEILDGTVNEVERNSTYAGSREDSTTPYDKNQQVWFNYNDVLVFHNGKDAAVYIVSFENFVNNTNVPDWAQTLWERIIPGVSDKSAAGLKFYGVADSAESPSGPDDDQSNRTGLIVVTYGTAKRALANNKSALSVTSGSIKAIADVTDGRKTISESDIKIDASGKSYEVTVAGNNGTTRTYRLVQLPQDDTIGDLELTNSLQILGAYVITEEIVANPDSEAAIYVPSASTPLGTVAAGLTTDAGDTIKIKAWNTDGEVIYDNTTGVDTTHTNSSIANAAGSKVTMYITNNDGYTVEADLTIYCAPAPDDPVPGDKVQVTIPAGVTASIPADKFVTQTLATDPPKEVEGPADILVIEGAEITLTVDNAAMEAVVAGATDEAVTTLTVNKNTVIETQPAGTADLNTTVDAYETERTQDQMDAYQAALDKMAEAAADEDEEGVAAAKREALIALADEITTTDAALEEALGKTKPLFCAGVTYKLDPVKGVIYVTGGSVDPLIGPSTKSYTDEQIAAMIYWWYGDKATWTVDEESGKYKINDHRDKPWEGEVTKETIIQQVCENQDCAFLTIDCSGLPGMAKGQDTILSVTISRTSWETIVNDRGGIATVTPEAWKEFDEVKSVKIDVTDLNWGTAE